VSEVHRILNKLVQIGYGGPQFAPDLDSYRVAIAPVSPIRESCDLMSLLMSEQQF
jgi:hypothetical protein